MQSVPKLFVLNRVQLSSQAGGVSRAKMTSHLKANREIGLHLGFETKVS